VAIPSILARPEPSLSIRVRVGRLLEFVVGTVADVDAIRASQAHLNAECARLKMPLVAINDCRNSRFFSPEATATWLDALRGNPSRTIERSAILLSKGNPAFNLEVSRILAATDSPIRRAVHDEQAAYDWLAPALLDCERRRLCEFLGLPER
jgi:hypothetical protein